MSRHGVQLVPRPSPVTLPSDARSKLLELRAVARGLVDSWRIRARRRDGTRPSSRSLSASLQLEANAAELERLLDLAP
jgi:hypothetical protein